MGEKLIEEFWILLQLYSCKCPHFPNISHMLILYIFQQIYTHKNILFDTFFHTSVSTKYFMHKFLPVVMSLKQDIFLRENMLYY